MGNHKSAQAILQAPSAYLAKSIGSNVTHTANHTLENTWELTKVSIMWEILNCKVIQSPKFRQNLMDTGRGQLADNLIDPFWGSSFQGRRHYLLQQDWFARLLMELRKKTTSRTTDEPTKTPPPARPPPPGITQKERPARETPNRTTPTQAEKPLDTTPQQGPCNEDQLVWFFF